MHVYKTEGGSFWCIRKFLFFSKNQGSGGIPKVLSTSPYQVVPQVQGTY